MNFQAGREPFKIGEGVRVWAASEQGIADVVDYFGESPDNDDAWPEPEHHESLSIVPFALLQAEVNYGSAFDQIEAHYAGFTPDIDSAPTDGRVGYTLPVDRMTWSNLETCDWPDGSIHNGW